MITKLGPRILFTALEFSTLPNITPGMLPTNSYLPDSYPTPWTHTWNLPGSVLLFVFYWLSWWQLFSARFFLYEFTGCTLVASQMLYTF